MNKGYAICLNEWLEDDRINNELRLLLKISNLTAQQGHCFATNEYLANEFNLSSETISRKIKKLEELGYLKITYEKRGAEIKNRYITLASSSDITNVKNINRRLTKISTDDCEKNQSTIDENVKDNNTNIINNTNINNITPLSPYEIFKEETNYQDETYLKINDWLMYKDEKNQNYTSRGLKGLFTILKTNIRDFGEKAVCNVIDESMSNNYQGIMWDKLARTYKQANNKPFLSELSKFALREELKNDKTTSERFHLPTRDVF